LEPRQAVTIETFLIVQRNGTRNEVLLDSRQTCSIAQGGATLGMNYYSPTSARLRAMNTVIYRIK
jgi:hypothetical protein